MDQVQDMFTINMKMILIQIESQRYIKPEKDSNYFSCHLVQVFKKRNKNYDIITFCVF